MIDNVAIAEKHALTKIIAYYMYMKNTLAEVHFSVLTSNI